jgi:hypothetical protein
MLLLVSMSRVRQCAKHARKLSTFRSGNRGLSSLYGRLTEVDQEVKAESDLGYQVDNGQDSNLQRAQGVN